MSKSKKDRLVGGLGGAGGSLALGTLLSYILWNHIWVWEMFLAFEIIGIFLITLAIIVHIKE
jgi:hypothetical protein